MPFTRRYGHKENENAIKNDCKIISMSSFKKYACIEILTGGMHCNTDKEEEKVIYLFSKIEGRFVFDV